jgi:subtilisin family serine protease
MRRTILLLMLMGAMLLLYAIGALTQARSREGGGPDRYIVVLNDAVNRPGEVASGMSRRHNLQVGFVYSHALKGFSATIPQVHLDEVRAEEQVDYVERDGRVHAVGQLLPWGTDRIDADISSTLAGNGSGEILSVNAYIIDSGVDALHADLNVVNHVNFRGDGKNYDCSGHGTLVTGVVAAKDNSQDVVGVAPGAPITGVKVLGCDGSGTWSGVIKGVDWVTANAVKPAIANMSLGGGASQSVDDAVRRSANSGILYSIAAGNDGQPACNYSPARAGLATSDTNGDGKTNHDDSNGIVTTAATNSSEEEASFSNYGKCVDIWAPGVNLRSTKMGGGISTAVSGTSMAAPHVGGGGGLYLSTHASTSPLGVEEVLKATDVSTGTTSKSGRAITRLYVGGF